MPLQKLQFRPGVNREGTTLANEGGWFECDKIRFRSGYPEKIGGWILDTGATNETTRPATGSYWGLCRSMWNWSSLSGSNLLGMGTNLKYYIQDGPGGFMYDVTPIRSTQVVSNPFTTTTGSSILLCTVPDHGAITGDFVTVSGVAAGTYNGIPAAAYNQEFQLTYVNSNQFTVDCGQAATSSGAASTGYDTFTFQINTGYAIYTALTGWGAGTWGGVVPGTPVTSLSSPGISASDTTIPVLSTTAFATASVGSPKTIIIDGESITYTGKTTGPNTFTGCVRGANGTTAAAHSTSATVTQATSSFTAWGAASTSSIDYQLRLWSESNFGQDLIANVRGGGFYYWGYSGSFPRMVPLSTQTVSVTIASPTVFTPTNALGNGEPVVFSTTGTLPTGLSPGQTYYTVYDSATGIYNLSSTEDLATLVNVTGAGSGLSFTAVSVNCPTVGNYVLVSDASRFVLAFGVNDYNSATQDPMLVRWSDQESYTNWTPAATNQAGSYRLSQGSEIITAAQTRQEVLVWTDTALYSMQYLGPPYVWGTQILASNISIMGPNATATVNNVTYWMGADKFYMYSGRVETLPCTLRQYVYDNINVDQSYQFFAGTNEGYNEVWWFYCSVTGTNSDGTQGSGTPNNPNTVIDRYVVFNHLERTWYYGSLNRTAWLDSPLRAEPMAAGYASLASSSGGTLIYQETGNDNGETSPATPIEAYVQSSDFDIGDGHNFGIVWRIIPDVTFDGSDTASPSKPSLDFTVRPRQNPGANYGSSDSPTVTSTQSYANQRTYNVQQFTEYVYVRIRGRQMAFRVSSNDLGVAWQLGTPRLDVRPDGRR